MTPSFGFDRVSAVRRDQHLFDTLTFTLAPGDAALVTGANGAGKSTLLRIAAGLLPPSAGTVSQHGVTVALLAEATALDADRTLGDALRFWAALDGGHDLHRRVNRALGEVDLQSIAGVPVRLLSTGQRRRAALARVMASAATLWLLDEPASGLDSDALGRLDGIIAAHRTNGGMAIIATHQPIDLADAHPIMLGRS